MLKIENLRRTFSSQSKGTDAPVRAVDDVSLEVHAGEFFTLLGPSGCGKTTILRSIAGLEKPDAGTIRVAGRTLFASAEKINIPSNERGLGMVFQSYAIWPHMNVHKNVSFPLEVLPRAKRPSKQVIRERVERALTVVELDHLASRRATDLSGGQQQRLALARALVMEPPLLLLDEPLSNLDAKLREGMRFELMRLQRDVGATAIYVTHDQSEALAMSSRIAVLRAGQIQQIGAPHEIYAAPSSEFVADFIGSSNFMPGVVEEVVADSVTVRTDGGTLTGAGTRSFAQGDQVVVAVRPEDIELREQTSTADAVGRWQGVVDTTAYLGETVDHLVTVGSVEVRVRVKASAAMAVGTKVELTIDPSAAIVLAKD